MNLYKKLFAHVPKQKYLANIAIVSTAISTIFTVVAFYYIYRFLVEFVVNSDMNASKTHALNIVIMLVLNSVFYIFALSLTHIVAFRLETNLRKRGIDGLTNASFKFFDMHSSGKTRRLIDDNASQTHMIMAHLMPDIVVATFIPILTLILSFVINIRVGIVLIILVAISVFLVKGMTGQGGFLELYQKQLENLSNETVEYIRGMQVVKIFGNNLKSFKSLYDAITLYSKYALDYSMSCKNPYVIFQVMFFALACILIPIVVMLNTGIEPKMTAVYLIMIIFLAGVLFNSFMRIMYVSMNSFMASSAVDKLEDIYQKMQKDNLEFGNRSDFFNFDIEFDNVSFAYEEEKVLENLSFKLSENRSYALVGQSGSGKSTVAKLISGFYNVDSGYVKIGGYPIQEYSQDAIMKNIAFVFQDSKLFNTSIYENVSLANPNATKQEVMNALSLAMCDDILNKFPAKENTVIGSKGVFLSGGEKQRIAIARAILKNAKIIIMDEASASVDPENEHELQKAFANLMKDKTVLMIAHRLTSIRNVDEILVMEQGKIVERGDDTTLMLSDTRYKKLQDLYSKANEWRVNYE